MNAEGGLVPSDDGDLPVSITSEDLRVAGGGWQAMLIAMVLIGCVSLRPSPSPAVPLPIAHDRCEVWMADALPGIGARTREAHHGHINAGRLSDLPERSREVARQVFRWPADPPPSGSAGRQGP